MLKNRLTYALVAVVLFLFIYLQEHRMTYMAFYVVLIMPILSYLVGLFSKRHFSISEKLSSDFIMKEQETVYRVTIRNHSFLPCSFARIRFDACTVGLEVGSKEKYFSLLPYKYHEASFQIRGIYRGQYDIGIRDITFYDFLGLFQFKLPENELHSLTIMPHIISISDLPLDSATGDASSSSSYIKGEDYSNVAELRAFQSTDSYRQIHWKASAKKGELISKNFHEEEEHAVTFFIDNIRPTENLSHALAIEDRMIEMVVSAMSYCCRAGYPVSIKAMGGGHVDFTHDFTRLYQEVSKLTFNGVSGFNVLLNDYLNSEKVQMNLFVFVRLLNDVLIVMLQSLIFAGNRVTVFVFKHMDDDMIGKLRALNVNLVFIENVVQVP